VPKWPQRTTHAALCCVKAPSGKVFLLRLNLHLSCIPPASRRLFLVVAPLAPVAPPGPVAAGWMILSARTPFPHPRVLGERDLAGLADANEELDRVVGGPAGNAAPKIPHPVFWWVLPFGG